MYPDFPHLYPTEKVPYLVLLGEYYKIDVYNAVIAKILIEFISIQWFDKMAI